VRLDNKIRAALPLLLNNRINNKSSLRIAFDLCVDLHIITKKLFPTRTCVLFQKRNKLFYQPGKPEVRALT